MGRKTLHTPLAALQFAVQFAQADLDGADLREVSQRLRDFDIGIPGAAVGSPWSGAVLGAVQADVLQLLGHVAGRGVAFVDLQLKVMVVREDEAFRSPRSTRRVSSGATGAIRDRVLYRLIRVLEEVGAEKLRVCPAPDCGRVFVKVTRKAFCSTRCQSRIYMRSYREENEG